MFMPGAAQESFSALSPAQHRDVRGSRYVEFSTSGERLMPTALNEMKDGLKSMIVDRLRLSILPENIADGAPLFGGGAPGDEAKSLGLDSVEALEIVVGIEEKWGVVIEDDSVSKEFYSINTLAALVSRLLSEDGKKAAGA
jgi:acyl carrier protein